jgi:hypothetical protein
MIFKVDGILLSAPHVEYDPPFHQGAPTEMRPLTDDEVSAVEAACGIISTATVDEVEDWLNRTGQKVANRTIRAEAERIVSVRSTIRRNTLAASGTYLARVLNR